MKLFLLETLNKKANAHTERGQLKSRTLRVYSLNFKIVKPQNALCCCKTKLTIFTYKPTNNRYTPNVYTDLYCKDWNTFVNL